MANRKIMNSIDWFSSYITSISSNISSGVPRALPIPTIPESVSESISANTYEQQIVSRSAPIVSYVSTGARTVSFTFTVSDQYMPTKSDGSQYNIKEYVDAFKSLEYPNYKSNEVVVPQAILVLGSIKVSGIVTQVGITWRGPVSDAISGGTFTLAEINLSFKEVRNSVLGSIQIKEGAY